MKKTTLAIVIATLCFFFKASGQDNKAIDVTTKGIQVGQQVPDLTINNIHNYKTTTAQLSDFKGKLVIIDFWATWCSPCIAAMPKMDKLQKQFGTKIQILPVTHQNEKEAMGFMSKLPDSIRPDLPMITSDTILSRLFPHVYLPHYVWIDEKGTVKAITGADGLTAKNITGMLEGQSTGLQRKQDFNLAYDDQKPFLIGGNGGSGESMHFHSVMTGYQQGLPSRYTTFNGKKIPGTRITFLNVTIPHLFAYAMGANKGAFNFKNMRFLVNDKSALLMTGNFKDWMPEHTFCYELILPKSMENDKYNIMLTDLKRMFPQYQVNIESNKEKVLALVRKQQIDKLKSKGGTPSSTFDAMGFELKNFPLNRLVAQLSAIYLQNHPLPVIDDTGYTDRVDIKVTASLSNVEALNEGLQPYGLALEPIEKEIEILVFRDK
jgi:thiol-disulfide isomerase/thioredoxin